METSSKSKSEEQTKKNASEITFKQFLDFLKTAYQVNDSVEGMLLAEGMTDIVDWIKLKESELVKPRDFACQTEFKKKSESSFSNSSENVKRKLNEVLSEGILDSVLSNMIPMNSSSNPMIKKPTSKNGEKSNSNPATAAERSLIRRRSSDGSKIQVQKTCSSDVIIHVCDEVKNAKKDFVCNQDLLVQKMGYFAEVTEGQRLEDMDISVHCDIHIFEWLMMWVKREGEEDGPELDPQCVVPILVSAAFLQMEPLLENCLFFCHEYMNDILRTSTNLSCLNETVLSRLAAMYTNTEVEAIRDRKDKIQSRLYCKLIQSLCEPETESMRGHWNSLARVYRCGRCQKMVSPSTGEDIPCIPACMQLQVDGSVTYKHEHDSSWNINDHIDQLYRNLKTWRKIYWHLWGDAHFLYCTICKRYFPCNQISWCRYHPDPPQFFTIDAQKSPLPVGRYPCCGERAFRFELIERETGCQFRDHAPLADNVRDNAVLSLLDTFRTLIEEEPVKLTFPERLTRLAPKDSSCDGDTGEGFSDHNSFWWDGFVVIPPRPRLGLMGCLQDARKPPTEEASQEEEEEEGHDVSDSESSTTSSSDSESSSRHKSDDSVRTIASKDKDAGGKTKRRQMNRLWQCNLSARSNQDLQRAYEESVLKQIQTVLTRRSFISMETAPKSSHKTWPRHITPPGGVWVRLESEWKERNSNYSQQQKMRNIFTGRSKIKTARFS
ncbi:hypothetical protein FQR65_LT00217 [Abscondita terminalis]|nr:hypothetical protein FQR65_LT00217 [Abscondita terminalis]